MDNQNNPPVAQNQSQNASDNMVMGVLSYIGPLVIISYLIAKDNPFVKFHIKQGIVLLVIEVGLWVLGMLLPFLWPIIKFIDIAIVVLAIIGIVRVVKGKEEKLPIVGDFERYVKI